MEIVLAGGVLALLGIGVVAIEPSHRATVVPGAYARMAGLAGVPGAAHARGIAASIRNSGCAPK